MAIERGRASNLSNLSIAIALVRPNNCITGSHQPLNIDIDEPLLMTLPDIFQPYDSLVEIEIAGTKYMVPANNTLLRCFQYLSMESISYGDFCWNGDCLNCQVWLAIDDKEKAVMACRQVVAEGMRIVRMSEGIELEN